MGKDSRFARIMRVMQDGEQRRRVIARRLPARGDIASWRGEKPPLSVDGHRGSPRRQEYLTEHCTSKPASLLAVSLVAGEETPPNGQSGVVETSFNRMLTFFLTKRPRSVDVGSPD